MDLNAWIALAGVCLAGFVQLGAILFMFGGLFQRVKSLEGRPTDVDCKQELAILSTKFEAMEDAIKEMAHDIKNLITGRVIPAKRRGADIDA